MKKFLFAIPAVVAAAVFYGGCTASPDYTQYISETRSNVFLYEGDDVKLSIYCGEKESPFVADGIRGKLSDIVEIYVRPNGEYENVTISSSSFEGGEMSYLSARGMWYMSFSAAALSGDTVNVTLDCDGTKTDYTLLSVLSDGVMNCEKALDCVREHDGELFNSLTENGTFRGEIFIRLLYDEKCYYYVGVCDREGNIHAYLTDAQTGRIVAERTHSM